MNRLWLFLALCVTLLVHSTAVEDESAEHDIVCEGSVMRLRCSNNSFAITIQSAIYGRNLPGTILCPKLDTDTPSSDELTCNEDVYSMVKELCDGRMNCSIPTNKETLNEPCPNVYKYLDVAYKCEDVLMRGYRQLEVLNLSHTPTVVFSTSTKRARTSTVALAQTPSLVQQLGQFSTERLSHSSSASSPTSQHSTTSSSYRVSVTRVSQPRQFTTTTAMTNLRSSTPLISPPPSSNPKTTENKTVETHANMGQHGTMKLFQFILSFKIVRQEKIEKHTANSIVWFFLGLLLGLLIMSAVFVFYRVKRCRRKRQGKPDKASYSKQEPLDTYEKLELNSKKMEALEMESQFGETV